MISKLPSLLSKSFVIGYFLPVGILLLGLCVGADQLGFVAIDFSLTGSRELADAVHVGLLIWLVSLLFVSLNREIIRYFEGYAPRWLPFAEAMRAAHVRAFRAKKAEMAELDAALRDPAEADSPSRYARQRRLVRLVRDLATGYPHEEHLILPTRFGNAIRAFEVHSAVLYNLDAIGAWPRIFLLLSEEAQEAIGDAKAQVDFWVNLWLSGLLLIGAYVILLAGYCLRLVVLIFAGSDTVPVAGADALLIVELVWLPAIAAILASVAAGRAVDAAVAWGVVFKSGIDLHWRALIGQMIGEETPTDPQLAAGVDAANQAFLYRLKADRGEAADAPSEGRTSPRFRFRAR